LDVFANTTIEFWLRCEAESVGGTDSRRHRGTSLREAAHLGKVDDQYVIEVDELACDRKCTYTPLVFLQLLLLTDPHVDRSRRMCGDALARSDQRDPHPLGAHCP